MILITWNIQWGRGVDGRVDLRRIVETARALGDFDVLCLQEVADNFPALDGAGSSNQFAQLADLLPGYHLIEGVAVERHTAGRGRQRFGNAIAARVAPAQVLRHQLPGPADASHPSMPRLALEAVFATDAGSLRVLTTHLEYYSELQRDAQLERLRALQAEAAGHAGQPTRPDQARGPFELRPRGAAAVVCGDFNCDVHQPGIVRLQQPIAGAPAWRDAWTIAHGDEPHPATVGRYDDAQWHGQQQTFDFFFVSEDLAPRVRRVVVDGETRASDHQPVLLELDASLRAFTENT